MQMMNVPLDFVCIVEKYENTNEMAVVMMTGKTLMAEHWMRIQRKLLFFFIHTFVMLMEKIQVHNSLSSVFTAATVYF